MSLDCNQTKERLEELIDQIVDAGLRAKAAPDENELSSRELSLALTLSSECQDHLNQCADCRDYQTANRMLIDAAAVLPVQEVPQADLLTSSIMQLVMAESAYDLEAPAYAVEKPAYALENQVSSQVLLESAKANKSYREIYLVILSFAAFATTSAYGLQLDESLWNIGSWSIALLLFAALKPFIEQGPNDNRALRNIGMPA